MEILIHFQSSVPRRSVVLHAWEPQGETWDLTARDAGGGVFSFTVKGPVADQRSIRFKFRFPDERRWEGDDLVRIVPTRRCRVFWTFDHSARVMTRDPMAGAAPRHVAIRLLTRSRFSGGALYAWQPGTDKSARFPETSRDAGQAVSRFDVRFDQADRHLDWMRGGFHFKFIDRDGGFEADTCNRVWRPSDGDTVSVKSGQASVSAGDVAAKQVTIGLLYPKALGAAPALKLVDLSGEPHQEIVSPGSAPPSAAKDPRFVKADYVVSVYPEAPYALELAERAIEGPLSRPLRVAPGDQGSGLAKLAIVGEARWLDAEPAMAAVRIVFHPRGWTAPLGRLAFDLAVGNAPPFDWVPASRASDGSWQADTQAPVGLVLQALPIADKPIDRRPDGPVSARRRFELQDASSVELHTVDAQPGFVVRPQMSAAKVAG